jgi:hypothetical protein
MDSHPFFRFVWRFNAVALCLAILAAGIATFLNFAHDFLAPRIARPAVEPTVSSETDVRSGSVELGTFTLLKGTPFMYAYLSRRAEGARSSASSRETSSPPNNIVLYDTRDGSARNLLTNDRQSVLDAKPLPTSYDDGRPRDVEALMLEVAHGETDIQPPTFQNSHIDIILFSSDGMRRLDVVRNVRSAYRVDGPGDGRVFVFASESDGLLRAYEVDFRAFAITPKGEVKHKSL